MAPSHRGLRNRLAGLNTVEVLGRKHRVVFAARVERAVGLIEIICAGLRTANAVYDVANALVRSGRLPEELATVVSRDEADAAMRDGYDESGQPDQYAALAAVMRAARTRSEVHWRWTSIDQSHTFRLNEVLRSGGFLLRARLSR